jgi:hypothetical protein
MESIIKMVLDSNWTDLNSYTEKRAADKIIKRISDKKQDIIDKLNMSITSKRK